jgi:hypothetical protein
VLPSPKSQLYVAVVSILRALKETVNVVSVRASKREKQWFTGGFTMGESGIFTTRLSVSEQAGEVRLITKVTVYVPAAAY